MEDPWDDFAIVLLCLIPAGFPLVIPLFGGRARYVLVLPAIFGALGYLAARVKLGLHPIEHHSRNVWQGDSKRWDEFFTQLSMVLAGEGLGFLLMTAGLVYLLVRVVCREHRNRKPADQSEV